MRTPVSERSEYDHAVLGKVTVIRSVRARRLSLSVRAGGEVRLTVPAGIGSRTALRFLEEKADWALRAKERMAERYPKQIIAMPYATRSHVLRLYPCPSSGCSVRVSDGVIRVSYPSSTRYDDPNVQQAIRNGIETAWRIEAKNYLPERVEVLSRALHFPCGAVTVRNTRSRWGSCSVDNRISLSIQLMKLPDRLIDYVIIHELCHTRIKNHGPRFYELLDRMTGGHHEALRKELKGFSARWI